MAYPVQASALVAPDRTFSLPFQPAAAGLVTAIVIVNAEVEPLNGGSGGNGPGGGGSGGGGHPPAAGQGPGSPPGGSPVFIPHTLAVQVDVFKPGAATPAGTQSQSLVMLAPGVPDQLVFSVNVPASGADLTGDWRVQVTNPVPGLQTKFELASAQCAITVRYQVQPGNLGKIDHMVVVMMENRSFDHMLGYLSIPPGHQPPGRGRTDVDGLTGQEYNNDPGEPGDPGQPPAKCPVTARQATYFATDLGHGWGDVQQQLSNDPADPNLPSNAGFVANFRKNIDADVASFPPGTATVTAQRPIPGGGSVTVGFRPVLPGLVSVTATPANPPTHSETGLLGAVALRLPGQDSDLIHVQTPIGQTGLGLDYQATAAQLAAPGNWSCLVTNGTDVSLDFTIDIEYVEEPHNTAGFEAPAAAMDYYTQDQLPTYDLLASTFAICDRWYASLPTDTWPNRLYGLTGGCGGLLTTPSDSAVEQGPPGFLLQTIFEVLQEAGVDWNVFFSDLPFALIFSRLAQDATYTSRMRPVGELITRAATGELPSFCWIDPNFQDVPDAPNNASDDHPPGDVTHGQAFIGQIYNALAAGPAWAKTLLVITYDEHGGFYDHVLPPSDLYLTTAGPQAAGPQAAGPPSAGAPSADAPAVAAVQAPRLPGQQPVGDGPPDDDPYLHRYGLRVPALVVSPWVVAQSVSHGVFDHTSLLSTALHRFCTATDGTVPSMGKRADNALSLDPLLASDQPALNPPQASGVTVNPIPVPALTTASGSFADVLRTSLFGF